MIAAAAALLPAGSLFTAPAANACPSGFVSEPFTGQCHTPNALPTVAGRPLAVTAPVRHMMLLRRTIWICQKLSEK